MRQPLIKFRAQRGTTTTEYASLVALLNVALIVALVFVQQSSHSKFEEVAKAMGGGSSSTLDDIEATR